MNGRILSQGRTMADYPQVALFGSIGGGWREQFVIPLLEELEVSYFNPVSDSDWNPQLGGYEAEVMANCETIVMVINRTRPAFTALAETGWAALGAAQRGQHFILQVDLDYAPNLPETIRHTQDGQRVEKLLKHWTASSRYLVHHHAKQFDISTMHIVEDIQGVLATLHDIYD
jgi:hypothetical protein